MSATQITQARAAILREWFNAAEDRRWNEEDMNSLSFEESACGGVWVEDDTHSIRVLFRDGVEVDG